VAESLNNQQAVFPLGKQRAFIEATEKKLSVPDMARLCACSTRTIRDWRREKFAIQLACLHTLCKKIKKPVPRNLRIRNRYRHVRKAGKKGAIAVMAKYGRVPVNETRRRKRWFEWWNSEGKFKPLSLFRPFSILKPKKSVELAEFIGIMMGDGGISKRQVKITLHHIDDLPYSRFVVRLMEKLFGVKPSVRHVEEDSVNNIVVSRTALVAYLHSLGLPVGNKVKQNFDMPDWIKENRPYAIACLRGLVDTDGCIFCHRYRVNGKWYGYKKLSFTAYSKPLLLTVARLMKEIGLHPRIVPWRDVRLDSIADMKLYFTIVGSHNPKHLSRYRK